MKCKMDGCGKKHYAKGCCRKHYYWSRRHGLITAESAAEPEAKRFRMRVEASESGCWIWQGTVSFDGYGVFVDDKARNLRAHRFAYVLAHGDVPNGLMVRHKCDQPRCVNPDHLLAGTAKQNSQDSVRRGRNAFGESNGHSKLTSKHVEEIRSKWSMGRITQTQLANDYGVTQPAISRVISKETWAK